MNEFFSIIYDIWGWFWDKAVWFFDSLFNINDYFTGVLFTILFITVAGFLTDLFFSFLLSVRVRHLTFFNIFNPKSFKLLGELKNSSIPRSVIETRFSQIKALNRLTVVKSERYSIPRSISDIKPFRVYSFKPIALPSLTMRLSSFSSVKSLVYYNRDIKRFQSMPVSSFSLRDSNIHVKRFSLYALIKTIDFYNSNRLSMLNAINHFKLSNTSLYDTPRFRIMLRFLRSFYHEVIDFESEEDKLNKVAHDNANQNFINKWTDSQYRKAVDVSNTEFKEKLLDVRYRKALKRQREVFTAKWNNDDFYKWMMVKATQTFTKKK